MLCRFIIIFSSFSSPIPTSLTSKMQHRQEIDRRRSVVVDLPLEDGDGDCATFDLEKAVCSHGLFMMAPNRWDTLSKTLERPLRLSENINDDDHEQSVLVRITQSSDSPHSLFLHVFGTDALSTIHQRSLLVLFFSSSICLNLYVLHFLV